jgi:hypothetical protein
VRSSSWQIVQQGGRPSSALSVTNALARLSCIRSSFCNPIHRPDDAHIPACHVSIWWCLRGCAPGGSHLASAAAFVAGAAVAPRACTPRLGRLLTRRARTALGTATQCTRINDSHPRGPQVPPASLAPLLASCAARGKLSGAAGPSIRAAAESCARAACSHHHPPQSIHQFRAAWSAAGACLEVRVRVERMGSLIIRTG